MAFGVEALDGKEDSEEEEEAVELAKWFKLHLHPSSIRESVALDIPPLPEDVPLSQVYADMIGFLFRHAVQFFTSTVPDGELIWNRLKNQFIMVFACPNGWDTVEQGFLRSATVQAGILEHEHPASRVQFVTEAEASVHFAIEKTEKDRWLQVGKNFAVLDAGGSTVDISLYKCTATSPTLHLSEVTSSECIQAGSVFVDRAAEAFLRNKLATSKFGEEHYIQKMVAEFEKKTVRKALKLESISWTSLVRNADSTAALNHP